MNQNTYRRNFTLRLLQIAGLCTASQIAQGAGLERKATHPQTIVVLGDSLSAEYGLVRGTGWVALLEKRITTEKINASVINASVSGETTSGGRARLTALLTQHKPAVLVIELGANDALRGLALGHTEDNLIWMTQMAQKSGAKVLLIGMQVPPNYGSSYTEQFAGIFASVARKNKAGLVPFFLKGVADGADAMALFQADRIHPRAQAHPQMLENVWSALHPMLH